MDLSRLVRVLLRRWRILLIGMVVSVGAAYFVYSETPRTYEARSQIMMLMPPTASNPEIEISPFLYLPDGLSSLARVITLIPTTAEYQESMAAQGFEPAYTVLLDAREPIVTFTVEGASPANVLRTRDELMTRFADDLDRVQEEEGVPERQWAHVRVLHSGDSITASSGDALRNAAAAGMLGAIATLLVIALRERRSAGRAGSTTQATAPDTRTHRPPRPTNPQARTDRARRGDPAAVRRRASRSRINRYATALQGQPG